MIGTELDWFCEGLRVLLAVLMGCLAIPVVMQVIPRYTPLLPTYLWTEELATFLFVWIVMIGSMGAVWNRTHFDVRVTRDAKQPLFVMLQDGLVLVLILAFALIFFWYGIDYAYFGAKQRTIMMRQ
jgi:TRAP-type C4-dicarboxylate transport system permease small subunit